MISLATTTRMRDRWYRETPRSAVLATGLALGGGLAVGIATAYLQGLLPHALASFANSAGGWSALAFVLVRLSRAKPLLAAALGAVAFVAMVEGYSLGSLWRGGFYAAPFTSSFTLIGLVAGPVIGLSAALSRWASHLLRPLAVAPLSAVLIGEGVYGLTVVADTTSPVYWTIQLAAGAAATAAALITDRPGLRWGLAAAVAALAGAALFLVGYRLLGTVLAGG
jgi:hypothetical protein